MSADALLAEARARLNQNPRFATAHTPAEQEVCVRRVARELALFRSPIGRKAAAVYAAAAALDQAVKDFLTEYPDSREAIEDGNAALAAAGLSPAPGSHDDLAMLGEQFQYLPAELARWEGVIEVLVERIAEDAEPPENLDGPAEARRNAA